MNIYSRFIAVILLSVAFCGNGNAQRYKSERLRKAVEMLDLHIPADSLMPDTAYCMTCRDGNRITLRTNSMGYVEHVGIPLFADFMRFLQPSPVYDFLEYALLNWKYKITPNQLYLSRVIFRTGSWSTLLKGTFDQYDCSIENREDKMYIVSWTRNGKDVATVGIPIEYELLNNDTRRSMEQTFIDELTASAPEIRRPSPPVVEESDLCIYGTEGLFVKQGKFYLIDVLNQNVYYSLTTVREFTDTIVNGNPTRLALESVQPVVVRSKDYPAETFANLLECNDTSVPDINMVLDFHLSNYHRKTLTLPLSRLKAVCRQNGCEFYFACNGVNGNKVRGVLFASNLSKGYNHMISVTIPMDQLTADSPTVHADVYLYIPPIEKSKLFGITPKRKSNAKFKLP